MSLAMCMMALAVAGADDQKFGTPPPLSGAAPVAIAAAAPAAAEIKDAAKQEPWPLDLATATHIAFDNSENFRVIEFGVCGLNGYFGMHFDGPLTIARINADVPFARCKANAMALVRSVERVVLESIPGPGGVSRAANKLYVGHRSCSVWNRRS